MCLDREVLDIGPCYSHIGCRCRRGHFHAEPCNAGRLRITSKVRRREGCALQSLPGAHVRILQEWCRRGLLWCGAGDDNVVTVKGTRTTLIVRRGALRRFDRLKQATETLPVDVMWDRREGQRRKSAAANTSEKRHAERRQAPRFTWDAADFAVVETPPESRKKR